MITKLERLSEILERELVLRDLEEDILSRRKDGRWDDIADARAESDELALEIKGIWETMSPEELDKAELIYEEWGVRFMAKYRTFLENL